MKFIDRILKKFRRTPSGPATVRGHGDAPLRAGMYVRNWTDRKAGPYRVVEVYPKTGQALIDFGDGVRDKFPANLYVPAARRR